MHKQFPKEEFKKMDNEEKKRNEKQKRSAKLDMEWKKTAFTLHQRLVHNRFPTFEGTGRRGIVDTITILTTTTPSTKRYSLQWINDQWNKNKLQTLC